jgi:glutamate-5-semialdehyde dehydrogenase
MSLRAQLEAARQASRALARLSAAERAAVLDRVARALDDARAAILEANRQDVEAATGLSPALLDRLRLDERRAAGLGAAVRAVRDQPDPLAGETPLPDGPSGVHIARRRVPLGVIAIVFEARPNVSAECAALTLKSGNAVVLRGGKEARHSNAAIVAAIAGALAEARVPAAAVTLIEDSSRERVAELLGAVGLVDLVIPRGGAGLMALVDAHARVPVIRHGQGVVHMYLDAAADPAMAVDLAENAKTQRPGVCNALETLLVHEAVAPALLAALGPRLVARGVELRADPAARAALTAAGVPSLHATEADWATEFLGLVLAVRVVPSLEAALAHIEAFGTHHTASIVTADPAAAQRFLEEVDASCVLWNASTRLNDGGELGLGAEMGISTSKLHAYGPMSARELTAEKLVVRGTGQLRS